ncbi:peptidase S41 [Kiloniella spongiae]|uniref:Peptidase S41 n=1 Tax=Kiloniella spongiae TaxID=1489064 RepID=A0A0H2MCA0_9PROT|nr:S41 family peptidase [Kiloniella spongiae]KLN59958.1 peptidase S41 [Kiloniella spongiae]
MLSFKKVLLTTAFAIALPSGLVADSAVDPRRDTYRQLELFGDVFERIKANYVEEVSDEELIESAIHGMLTRLDPHSSYLTPDSFKDMRVQTRGEFGGLGIEVTMENGFVKVVSPIDDTPAARAGIEAGDYITHLDDEAVLGLTLQEAVEKMRGKVGSELKITISREGVDSFDVTLERDVIKVRSVRHRIEDNIGYVRVSSFNEQTTPGLEKSIKAIQDELGDKMVGLVLDLRLNPGGLLTEAISVSDAFLEQGEIVSTRGRDNSNAQRFNARSGDLINGKPLVVLINGGSASASEIVAGALQDHRRAIIMGTQSFGKGSVQTIMPLLGNGAMRLTTSRYYTPSGRSIQAEGIAPDIIVEQAKIETLDTKGQRREADLRGALDNKGGTNGTSDKNDDDKTDEAAKPQDYQLDRALDLIQGIALYSSSNGASN